MKNYSGKCIVIVGPTASGKTGYSIHLAQKIKKAEIISADSRQIYTSMDIGTGKVTEEEMRGIPHHMLDIVNPGEIYSAHKYATEARKIMGEIWGRGSMPIICGGTGLYIDALFGRVALGDAGRNDALRAELEQKSCEELFEMLQKTDSARAENIYSKGEQTNKVRLVRALEISATREGTEISFKKVLDFAPQKGLYQTFSQDISAPSTDKTLWLGLRPSPTELRANIKKRLLERLEGGMLDEVQRLHEGGVSWERMDKLGLEYRYCAQHLQGNISYEALCTVLEQKIWQYAKRQINWWKRNTDIKWFHPTEVQRMDAVVMEFLKLNSR